MIQHNTFVIERRYPQPPPRLFAAFADPAQKRRWFAEGGHSNLELFEMDFRAGGRETTRSRLPEGSPFPGVAMISEAVYLDIEPGERLTVASTMTIGERRISASLMTFEFLPDGHGCLLKTTHQGAFFAGSDGPEMREQGWRQILERLENATA